MGSIPNFDKILEAVKNVPGDFAEFGVYQGDCTIQMANGDKARRIWAWDTFSGMPDDDYIPELDSTDPPGKWSPTTPPIARFEASGFNIIPVVGRFSHTIPLFAELHPSVRYAFIHIDCDHYNAYRRVLEYLETRMNRGGIVRLDDYGCCKGAKLATDQFLKRVGKTLEGGDIIRF
jgi:O-methyltransferase